MYKPADMKGVFLEHRIMIVSAFSNNYHNSYNLLRSGNP